MCCVFEYTRSSKHCTGNMGDIYNLATWTITTENKPNSLSVFYRYLSKHCVLEWFNRGLSGTWHIGSPHNKHRHICSNLDRLPLVVPFAAQGDRSDCLVWFFSAGLWMSHCCVYGKTSVIWAALRKPHVRTLSLTHIQTHTHTELQTFIGGAMLPSIDGHLCLRV